ncbi:hypothetical protein [Streptomyces sp. NPDC047108]|uniref:hypothetical protein n=1 Tax=Streptomyces sp. NPDC047108 TaxID=3155025 RepID=UPI003411C5B2
MHLDGVAFTLARSGSPNRYVLRDQVFSWAGTVSGLGHVEMVYPTERSDHGGLFLGASVTGVGVPASSYGGREYGGRPSLADGELVLAGNPARLSRSSWGLTRRARALRIHAGDRSYAYAEVRDRRRHELRRPGACVRTTRSARRNPRTIAGSVHGLADGVDVALAVLLEGVDTRSLSLRGALLSAPGRLLVRLGD